MSEQQQMAEDLRCDETKFWHGQIDNAVRRERERCASVALEQRCERGTPWDLACTTIADKIREAAPRVPLIQAIEQTEKIEGLGAATKLSVGRDGKLHPDYGQ